MFFENGINFQGATAIADSLTLNSTLNSICLAKNLVEDKGALSLAESLLVNQSVQYLDLENCRLSSICCESLGTAARIHPLLECLSFSGTFDKEYTLMIVNNIVRIEAFLAQAQSSLALRQLYFRDCHLTSHNAEALEKFLKINQGLKVLNLSSDPFRILLVNLN
jgi:hypothetical protein